MSRYQDVPNSVQAAREKATKTKTYPTRCEDCKMDLDAVECVHEDCFGKQALCDDCYHERDMKARAAGY